MVAFTFDDGPSAETTPQVIAALEKYDVPATFFVVTSRIAGRRAAPEREALAKLVAGGFTLGSHSISHGNMKAMSTRAIRREVDGSIRALAGEAGRPIGLFRAPFGALDRRGRRHLKKRGLTADRYSFFPYFFICQHGDDHNMPF